MSELRYDSIHKIWVIMAAERALRPSGYQVEVKEHPQEHCPLCPGHESETPQEIFAIRNIGGAANSPGWSLRVIPNKYPALRDEGEVRHFHVGIHKVMSGVGAHEMVVETPHHDRNLAEQPAAVLAEILRVYRNRMNEMMQESRFHYVMLFRNQGENAGATLSHPHAQIIALPIIPTVVRAELVSTHDYYRDNKECRFCQILREEQDAQTRIVFENQHFIVTAPYASRTPYELMLMPRVHRADFTELSDQETDELSVALSETLGRLKALLDNPAYNLIIHSIPNMSSRSKFLREFTSILKSYHWHIEIIPRLSKAAGFEWGTGFYINSTLPEEAAKSLKAVKSIV